MGTFRFTTIKPLIGKIIRDTGQNFSAAFVDDLFEWIPEGLAEIECTYQLETKSTPNQGEPNAIVTKDHVAKLPTDMQYLIAVEDEFGRRIRVGSDVTNITDPTTRYHTGQDGPFDAQSNNFRMDPFQIENGIVPWNGDDIVPIDGQNTANFYKLSGNCIQTKLTSIFIKLHYKALLTDDCGYVMIPDLSQVRECIYWYVIGKMIGAGYKHAVIPAGLNGLGYCKNQFETYAARAMGKMMMPDEDQMAAIRDGFSHRIIPPNQFYEDFFIGAEQTQEVRGI